MNSIIKLLKPYKKENFYIFIAVIIQIFSALMLPNLLAEIVDIGIKNSDFNYILFTGLMMLIITIIGSLGAMINVYYAAYISTDISKNLRYKIFEKSVGLSLNKFEGVGTSSLITRATSDITQLQNFIVLTLRMIILAPFMLIGAVIMAVSKSPSMSLIILGYSPFLILAIYVIGKKGFYSFDTIQKKADKVNSILREKLTGIRVIRAFNKDDFEKKRFDVNNIDLTNTSVKINRIVMLIQPLITLILGFVTVTVIYFGVIEIDRSNIQVGDLVAFIQYVLQILMSFMMVSMMMVILPKALVSMNRVKEVLDIEPEAQEEVTEHSIKNGLLQFENVYFNFENAKEAAIKNISFTAKPGEITAIIGSTGSGKSTIAKLIPKLYDISKGKILIDNVNIDNYDKKEIRQFIGYVPQKALLFSGDIESNLKFGNEDLSDDSINNILKMSASYDFVESKENGIKANVAQGGSNFSGGQKQRLSIARAMAKEAEIYIFDDSFSALDYKTDKIVRKSIFNYIKDKTVILIAQRVSTIVNSDNILVLDNGEIVAQGKHKHLLESCSVYREIVESQDSNEEVE
ncbi:MAG: ABC transporter ATP-binding protein [Oscillospiraceae bacterium]